jgi:hypothetical protein
LQKLETELMAELAEVYGCDEDEVPVEIDLLRVYNTEQALRKDALVGFSAC